MALSALLSALLVAHPGDITLPAPSPPAPSAVVASTAPEAPGRSGPRVATLVGSLTVMATGVLFLAWAGARASDTSAGFSCLMRCGNPPPWLRAYRRGEGTDIDNLVGYGPALFPLGLSFLTSGATTLVGAELVEDEGPVPWVSILVGVAAGTLMYGVFEAAEPPLQITGR